MFTRAVQHSSRRADVSSTPTNHQRATQAARPAARASCPCGGTCPRCAAPTVGEHAADAAAYPAIGVAPLSIQRAVSSADVRNCGGEITVEELQRADWEARYMLAAAHARLERELALAEQGTARPGRWFARILQEQLGLSLADPAHWLWIREQMRRMRGVQMLLEDGVIQYACEEGILQIGGCRPSRCEASTFADSCPGTELVRLCGRFIDTPSQRALTVLHEPFHILFGMRHVAAAPRMEDADCMEAFIAMVVGRQAYHSCAERQAAVPAGP